MSKKAQDNFPITELALACIIIIVVIVLIQVYHSYAVTDVYEYGKTYIPTIEQLQQALTDTGNSRYDPCGVDGNPGPNTLKAWKNYSFDVYAGNKRILAEEKDND